MSHFETSATVQEQGQVLVAGVPFAPGTEVEVTISPRAKSDAAGVLPEEEALAASRARMRELFQTIKGFRLEPRFSREELYARGSLR